MDRSTRLGRNTVADACDFFQRTAHFSSHGSRCVDGKKAECEGAGTIVAVGVGVAVSVAVGVGVAVACNAAAGTQWVNESTPM